MSYALATKLLLQPLTLLMLLLGAALANLWRGRKERRGRLAAATALYLALAVACTPAFVYPVIGVLEWPYPPSKTRPDGTTAVVVLSGGLTKPDAFRPEPELAEDTLYRCLHAAALYHAGPPVPVVVTGGVLDPALGVPPVAPEMKRMLKRLGVADADVVVEPTARTTYENAVESAKILRARGLGRVALVTEAVHMRRSLLAFRKQGVDAAPAACHHRATSFEWKVSSFLPTPWAPRDLSLALHEWLGLAWYRLRGRS